MRYLFRKLLRDIRHSVGQYVAITLVITIGVACYVGMMSVAGSVRHNVDDFYSSQKLADLWVTVPGADESAIAQIRDLPDVAAADGRLSLTGTAGTSSFTIHAIPAVPTVNIPAMDDGRLPQSADECIIDRGYAAANHLTPGSTLSVTIATPGAMTGGTVYNLNVVGVFNSPEYLYLVKDITAAPDHQTFGALFVSGSLFPAQTANEIVVKAQPGADLAQLKSDIAQIAFPDGNGIILDRTQLLSWVQLNQDITQYGQLGAVFPAIFFVVAAAIIFISMSKNVETQRNQIGNMKALGISGRLITFHFLSYTLLTCLIGCVLGVLAGLFGVMPGLQAIFTAYYTMPALHATGFTGNIIVAALLAFAFGIAATLFSVRRTLRESPAAAMRPKPPRSLKPILLERTALWPRLTYGAKIVWRNLFLNKGRGLLSSIGIIGCVGLLLASFSFLDSINSVLGYKFSAMNQYDVCVTLASPVPAGATFPLSDPDIETAEPQGSLPASLTIDGQVISTNLTALDTNSTAIALFDGKAGRLSFPADGVIIPQLFANQYKLAAGDAITLMVSPIGGTPTPITVNVSAIGVQYLQQDIYTSFDYLRTLGLAMPVSTFFLTVADGTADDTATRLGQDPLVGQAITKTALAKTWSSEMNILNSMIWIMIAASAVLALTVVYNISAINIFERRRDIATLKVLGYHRGEVNRLVFRENLIITGFGVVLGLPVGVGMSYLLISAVVSNTMMVPLVVSPLSVLYSVVLGFAFTVLANQLLRGKIHQIDMVESLKSVE